MGIGYEAFLDGTVQTYVKGASDEQTRDTRWLANGQNWWSARCFSCKRSTVWRGKRLIFPSASTAPQAHVDMPAEARELYDEAREVLGVSPRAGAALARATLERLLRSLDPVAGKADLATRIQRVVPKVSSTLAQMLTVIRHVGNRSLPVEDEPDEVTVLVLSDDQTEVSSLLFEAINSLVDELITKQKVAKSIYSKLPTGVRAKVEGVLAEDAKD